VQPRFSAQLWLTTFSAVSKPLGSVGDVCACGDRLGAQRRDKRRLIRGVHRIVNLLLETPVSDRGSGLLVLCSAFAHEGDQNRGLALPCAVDGAVLAGRRQEAGRNADRCLELDQIWEVCQLQVGSRPLGFVMVGRGLRPRCLEFCSMPGTVPRIVAAACCCGVLGLPPRMVVFPVVAGMTAGKSWPQRSGLMQSLTSLPAAAPMLPSDEEDISATGRFS